MTQPVFRFAPSPNGRLHLGHAYSALLNAELAARCGGRLLLRIEDIDPVRSRPAFEAGIYEAVVVPKILDLPPFRLSYSHPPSLAASRTEATTSLGSRTRRIMRLSGKASISKGAPTEPFGSLITR